MSLLYLVLCKKLKEIHIINKYIYFREYSYCEIFWNIEYSQQIIFLGICCTYLLIKKYDVRTSITLYRMSTRNILYSRPVRVYSLIRVFQEIYHTFQGIFKNVFGILNIPCNLLPHIPRNIPNRKDFPDHKAVSFEKNDSLSNLKTFPRMFPEIFPISLGNISSDFGNITFFCRSVGFSLLLRHEACLSHLRRLFTISWH